MYIPPDVHPQIRDSVKGDTGPDDMYCHKKYTFKYQPVHIYIRNKIYIEITKSIIKFFPLKRHTQLRFLAQRSVRNRPSAGLIFQNRFDDNKLVSQNNRTCCVIRAVMRDFSLLTGAAFWGRVSIISFNCRHKFCGK